MSDMPGNPHYEPSMGPNGTPEVGLLLATLALAYEQRTANLIALYSAKDWANKLDNETWEAVASQIAARLGLDTP